MISPLKRLLASPLQFRDHFAVESSLQSFDSARVEPREKENRCRRVPRQRSARHTELIENSFIRQWLAGKT
jgi:hypothetical protein